MSILDRMQKTYNSTDEEIYKNQNNSKINAIAARFRIKVIFKVKRSIKLWKKIKKNFLAGSLLAIFLK